jgi:DNA-binding NarL/FixJ family response regulator
MTVRIVVADDHPVVRKGLLQFFSEHEDLDVVAECADGAVALEAVRRHRPDVVVADLRMPKMTGIELLRKIREEELPSSVILLVGNISDDEVVEAMRAGVKGIVLKELAPNLLVQSIRKVAAGGVWLEKDAVGRAMERLLRREEKAQNAAQLLTPRERELVALVARGSSNRDIADTLFISEATVKTHLHTIFEKTSVKSRLQLATWARENGLG